MNKIATPRDLAAMDVLPSAQEKITVLNPVGYPPKVTRRNPPRRGSRASTARPSIWSIAASTIRSSC